MSSIVIFIHCAFQLTRSVGQDDNFVGAGRESSNITIDDVKIHGLHANPIEIPSLITDEGAHMQGVARDLLRITDVSS